MRGVDIICDLFVDKNKWRKSGSKLNAIKVYNAIIGTYIHLSYVHTYTIRAKQKIYQKKHTAKGRKRRKKRKNITLLFFFKLKHII